MADCVAERRYYGLHDLDRKLERLIDKDEGTFFEAGASDCVNQSNTFYFEENRKWKGILVEPIPHRFLSCRERRGRISACIWAALVPPNWHLPFVELVYCDLMTITKSDLAHINPEAQIADWRRLRPGEATYNFVAPARTMSSILEEVGLDHIDLVSLDLEGFECAALRGLDLTRFDVDFFCIECRNLAAVSDVLGARYEVIEQLSYHDYLFGKKWR